MDSSHPTSSQKPNGADSSDSNSKSNANGLVTFKQFKSFRTFWEAQALDQASLLREILIEVGALKQWTSALDPTYAKQSAFLHDSDQKLKQFEASDIRTLLKKIHSLLEETGILINNDCDSATSSSSIPKFNPELKKIYQSYVKPSVSFDNIGKWAEKTVSSCHFGPLESPRSVIFPEKSKSDAVLASPSTSSAKTQKSQTNTPSSAYNPAPPDANRFKTVPISDSALAEMVKLIKVLLASAEGKSTGEPVKPSEIELPPSIHTDRRDVECPAPSARAPIGTKRSSIVLADSERELVSSGRIDCILAELAELKGRIEGLSEAKIPKVVEGTEEDK